MYYKWIVLLFGFNCITCIDLDEYEPTDYDWDGIYTVDESKLFSLLHVGLFVLSLIICAGLVAGFVIMKKKVCIILEILPKNSFKIIVLFI